MSLPDRTPTVAAAQTAEPRDGGVTQLLVTALTLLVGWSRRVRADARYVLAVAQHDARPALDPVDDHFDTAVRAAPDEPSGHLHAVATLPPQLTHLELLAGEERENVIRGLVALGRPNAMANPGGPDPAALDEMARDVDPRRIHAATLYLDKQFTEIVRRTP